MNIIVLGIDTSTAVSVGLARGSEVLVSLHYDDPRAHAEQLMPSSIAAVRRPGLL